MDSFKKLVEKVSAEDQVHYIKLPVSKDDLIPVFSEDAINLHYGVLYKNYVKNAHAGEGEFQVAGAYLHTIFFEQFQKVKTSNNPIYSSKTLIEEKFKSFQNFKNSIAETALSIHGNGWVYLDTKGEIKTISNHKIVNNIALLIDMWEHSYLLDYGADKEKYLKDIWKIIDWNVINTRLNLE